MKGQGHSIRLISRLHTSIRRGRASGTAALPSDRPRRTRPRFRRRRPRTPARRAGRGDGARSLPRDPTPRFRSPTFGVRRKCPPSSKSPSSTAAALRIEMPTPTGSTASSSRSGGRGSRPRSVVLRGRRAAPIRSRRRKDGSVDEQHPRHAEALADEHRRHDQQRQQRP